MGASVIVDGPRAKMIIEEEEYDDDVHPVPAKKVIEDDIDDDLNIDRPPAQRPADNDVSQDVKLQNISIGSNDNSRVVTDDVPPVKIKKEDPNAKMTKRVFGLNLAGVVVGLVCSLIVLYCLYKSYRSFQKDYFPFESIKETWSKDTIRDIKLSINGKCPSSAYTPLLQYDWPGLNQGCDCVNNTATIEKKVFNGSCTADQKTKGCMDSAATDGKAMINWRSREFLCVERYPKTNMDVMVLNGDPAANKCKNGFRMCPIQPKDRSGKDSLSWAMCFPEASTKAGYVEKCPLTLLKVASCPANPDINCYIDTPENKVELGGGSNLCLWKTNKCGRGPISTVVIGETGLCRHINSYQIGENHTEFSLIRKPRSVCGSNPDVELIDTQHQTDLFEQNGVILDNLRAFRANINPFNYSLFSAYYTKWTWPHRTSEDIYLIFNNKILIEKLELHHWNALMFFSIYVIICLFISPPLFYYESVNPDLYRYNRIMLFAKYSILWFFKITTVPVLLLIMKMNEDVYKKFKQYGSAEFSNTYENNKMHELAHTIENGVHKYDRVALWVACIVIMIDIILIILVCKTEEQKIKTEDLEVNMNESLTDGIELRVQ
jgi:hypothetical protein